MPERGLRFRPDTKGTRVLQHNCNADVTCKICEVMRPASSGQTPTLSQFA